MALVGIGRTIWGVGCTRAILRGGGATTLWVEKGGWLGAEETMGEIRGGCSLLRITEEGLEGWLAFGYEYCIAWEWAACTCVCGIWEGTS